MADYPSLPADGLTAHWTSWDDAHAHDVEVRWENEAWTATATVERERAEFVIRFSPFWQVRQFLLFRDLAEPDLWLGTDGRGRWGEINGAHRPDLDGALDVSLAVSPFPLALPVRRLPLAVGDEADTVAIDIDVETLGAVATTVRYHRLAEHRWAVGWGDDVVEFSVDEHGLPLDIEGRFRRIEPEAR